MIGNRERLHIDASQGELSSAVESRVRLIGFDFFSLPHIRYRNINITVGDSPLRVL